ncbi:SusC/RagA family TonB-linked outer membrane protein [Phocaeicola barnesiae]
MKRLLVSTSLLLSAMSPVFAMTATANTNVENGLEVQSINRKIIVSVVDKSGPIIGANVLVKGTQIGAITDLDGNAVIDGVPSNAVLVISYIGYITQEIPLKNSDTKVIVDLKEDTQTLSEVVVVGYGSVKKSDATGAVEVIKSTDFNQGIVSSPESLFKGHIAGVQVTPTSGQPGAGASVRIRGVNSISASSEPLYVIDGVPIDNSRSSVNVGGDSGLSSMTVNPLSMIPASDIESMTVLKDASATAIYGSRGANGVIIITTKGGKEGVRSLSYSGSVGFSQPSNKIDVLSADEYKKYVPDASGTASTDWQDEIFRTALVQEHNVTFSNGNKNTSYRAALNYSNQDGVVIGTGMDRYSLRFNLTHKMFDNRLLLGLNATNTYYKFDNVLEQQTGGSEGGIINNALKANPTEPVYKADGSFNEYAQTVRNPVAMAKQMYDKSRGDRFIANADATYFFIPEIFSGKVNIGYDIDNINRKAYQPIDSKAAENVEGRAITESNRYSNYLFEGYLTFNKTFKDIHVLNAVAGYSWQEFDNYTASVRAEGFVNDNLGANNIGGARTQQASNYQERNRLISFYARVNYNLMDKYMFTATVRRDGSSRFGINNRWATFPSGAFAWKIKQENFMRNVNFIDDLKLRLGYGITGNQDIGNFKYSQTYSIDSKQGTSFGGIAYPAYNITGIANPNLKWEETAQFNAGIDFAFLKNRLRGSVDVYHKKTSNLLLTIDAIQPAVSSTFLDNVGTMVNKGVEFTLDAAVISNKDFYWDANFNIAYNKNEVTELYNNKDIVYGVVSGAGAYGNTQILRVGSSIGSFYGQKFVGIENGKEVFESDERTIVGDALPDVIIGFNNTFKYKNWDLTMCLRSNMGVGVYNNTRAELAQGSRLPGQNTNLEGAEFYKAGGGGIVYSSSRWVEDASFLKLDNITLGYNFSLPKVIKSARVYVTAQNLFTITSYTGYDPEVNNTSSDKDVKAIGIDYCSYPQARSFILGLNLNF